MGYNRIMKTCLFIFALLVSLCSAADKPVIIPKDATVEYRKEGRASLADPDRLLIREAQVAMAQGHIARLQAEAQVREAQENIRKAEEQIRGLIQQFQKEYACQGCNLNLDFTWVKTEPSEKSAAPEKTGEQNKE